MRFERVPSPRRSARWLHSLALAAGILAVAAGPASAWILRYTTGYGLVPNPPLASRPVTFLLYGNYPSGCGSIVSSTVIDPGHVAIHLRSDATCPDSSVAEWMESFPLGMLAAGNHELTITLTMQRADSTDSTTVETASFAFGVEDTTQSPPPPPPPSVPPLVSAWFLTPSPPTIGADIGLNLTGFAPFPCAQLTSAEMIDTAHVAITLTAGGCADTSRVWGHGFSLGRLAAGPHSVDLAATLVDSAGSITHHIPFGFVVVDTVLPPPPPPAPQVVTGWRTDPAEAVAGEPVHLIVTGYTPFPCATLSDAAVTDTSRATITMTAVTTPCPDSLTAWTHTFDLGVVPAGHHTLELEVVRVNGPSSTTVSVPITYLIFEPGVLPPPPPDSLVTVLSPGRPNPFAAESRFSVSVENGTHASVAVFDVNGRRVRTVFDGRFASGTTQLSWDGRRDDGSRAPAGLYFYRLVLPQRVVSRRVVLLPTP